MAPTDDNCIFCKIVSGQIPCFKLFEDEHTLAFMDINPVHDGHALSIAKGHWPDIFSIPADAIGRVAQTARLVACAVNKTVAPDGINIVQANGQGAGQTVFHFHMHILPRRAGDERKLNWDHSAGDMGRIKAVYERILANMG